MTNSKLILLGAIAAFSSSVASIQTVNNMQYCNEVDVIQYTNVGSSGSYDQPTSYDDVNNDGSVCNVGTESVSYGGPLAPFNEQLSLFFRGPLRLYNFAVYYPNTDSETTYVKREASAHRRRHTHNRQKKHVKTEVVEEVVTVYAYAEPSSTSVASSSTAEPSIADYAVANSAHKKKKKGQWKRTGYYSAAQQKSEGLVFLTNKGGQGSGKFTSCFGNSLSYLSADGHSGASTPQVLADGAVLGVNEEFSIWTNQTCDGSCGFSYAKDVCYRGFDGDNKVFAFEFMMPTNTTNSGNIYGNSDMPSIWALNSKIGRTLQYPAKTSWSCWDTGCGECDLWEVLYWDNPASQYLTSSIHGSQGASHYGGTKGGGHSCDYMKRPTSVPMKGLASFLSDGTITISVLPASFDFPEYLNTADVRKCEKSSGLSKFPVPS